MSYEIYRRALTPLIRALYRIEVRGAENVPLAGRVVVTGNHDSVLDPFIMAAVISRPISFLGKAELWRVPGLDRWLDSLGAIPVERGRSDGAAIDAAIAALEAGTAVGIFPEGRVRPNTPWLRGAARVALATGSPLLPIRFLGTRETMGRGYIGFPSVAALIGEPIPVERTEPTGDLARELTDRLQAAVEALGT